MNIFFFGEAVMARRRGLVFFWGWKEVKPPLGSERDISTTCTMMGVGAFTAPITSILVTVDEKTRARRGGQFALRPQDGEAAARCCKMWLRLDPLVGLMQAQRW